MAPSKVFRMVFVPEAQIKNGVRQLGWHFWRHSLGNSYNLPKKICARDIFRPAGSEARGDGRERGSLLIITCKAPVAQRAGGI